ncbi:YfaP family protein [Salinivirga cyanobacteriivorans]
MNTKLLFLAMVAFLMAFQACEKDEEEDNDSTETVQDSYFNIEGAQFQSGSMPSESGGPEIANLSGNDNVLAGGGNPVSIETSGDASEVIIGVEGADGYFTYPVSSMKSVEDLVLIYLLFTQEIEGTFTIVFALVDIDGNVGTYQSIEVQTVEAGTGQFQVNLSWDQPNDMDLHLIEPNGEEIYYSNSLSDNGGFLDIDSNAGCSIDGTNSENITYGDTAIVEAGTYTVIVDRWSNCNVTGTTNFSVTATLNGELVSGNNPYYGSWASDYTNDQYVEVMTIDINSSMMKNYRSVLQFDYGKFEKKRNLSPQKTQ